MFQYYINAITKHYFDFNGRARRAEFWYFFLVNIIVAFVLGFVGGLAHLGQLPGSIYSLAVFLPSLGLSVRRMHDTDHSGWWILCPIMNIVFLFFAGTPGPNTYGPDPKGAIAAA